MTDRKKKDINMPIKLTDEEGKGLKDGNMEVLNNVLDREVEKRMKIKKTEKFNKLTNEQKEGILKEIVNDGVGALENTFSKKNKKDKIIKEMEEFYDDENDPEIQNILNLKGFRDELSLIVDDEDKIFLENKFKDYSKNVIDLINSLISHYRKSLSFKSKEVEFLQRENELLRERVAMLQEVSLQYEVAAEHLIIDTHVPKKLKELQNVQNITLSDACWPSTPVLEKDREHKSKRDNRTVNGGLGRTTFTRIT